MRLRGRPFLDPFVNQELKIALETCIVLQWYQLWKVVDGVLPLWGLHTILDRSKGLPSCTSSAPPTCKQAPERPT